MSKVTADGFQADDLTTIQAGLVGKMQAIFGADISLDPSTVDGETLGIYAEAKVDSDLLAEDVYNSWNPQTATGLALSRIVQFNGIRRIPAETSLVTITCEGTIGTHIPIGSLIASQVDQQRWHTIQDAIISATGAVNILAMSVNYGAIQAPPYTLTQMVTGVPGWQKAYNREAANVGRDAETDEELRIRRAASTKTPAQAVQDAVYSAVANIPRVTQVRLYENKTELPDINGLPPHSFCLIVQGGEDYDIAAAIWNRGSIGATQVGNRNVNVADIQGFTHVITFMRPLLVRIFVSIGIRALRGWNEALIPEIKNNLGQWAIANWGIGSELIYSRLYESINTLPNVFSVTSVTMDTVTPPVRMSDIQLPFGSIAVLDPADVTVFYQDQNPCESIGEPPPPIVLPTITNINPSSGVTTGGTTVIIRGTNYALGEEVWFGAVLSPSITVDSSEQITCVSPPNQAGPVAITVSLGGQSVTLDNAFNYIPPVTQPLITSITPCAGKTTGGTAVVIRGENLLPPPQGVANAVEVFGYQGANLRVGNATNVVFVNDTQITCNTPNAGVFWGANSGTFPFLASIGIWVGPGTTTRIYLADSFTYIPPPTWISLTPYRGPTAGGNTVTISGLGFRNCSPRVTFGTTPATNVVVVDNEHITCTAPAGVANSTPMVNVFISDVQMAVDPSAFYVYSDEAGVAIISINPNRGSVVGGTVLTIRGVDFPNSPVTAVTFGDANGTVGTRVNQNEVQVTTPAHAPGSVTVYLIFAEGGGASVFQGFTFDVGTGPYVSNVSPNSGPLYGGTDVTITGMNFVDGLDVHAENDFGATDFLVDVEVVNSTTIRGHTAGMFEPGLRSVTVINPDDQRFTLSKAFTFIA